MDVHARIIRACEIHVARCLCSMQSAILKSLYFAMQPSNQSLKHTKPSHLEGKAGDIRGNLFKCSRLRVASNFTSGSDMLFYSRHILWKPRATRVPIKWHGVIWAIAFTRGRIENQQIWRRWQMPPRRCHSGPQCDAQSSGSLDHQA